MKVNNKSLIDKCIISFSHDQYESRVAADRFSIEKAQKEIAQNKKGISHLILRARDDKIDRLKFLFLIHGIPLMCYSLGNLILSSLKEIVVVGSQEVKTILDLFLQCIDTKGKKIHFVHEDPDNLMLINTMILGRNVLSLSPNELVLFQPGDLPFMFNLEKVIQDKDIKNHNLILWLNSREEMFPRYHEDPNREFVQRNYHYRIIDEKTNRLHDLKEPNVYPINLGAIEEDIIELLHQTRKDGKIIYAGLNKALKQPARMLRLLPILANHFRHFESDLKKFRMNDDYKFGMHRKNFNQGASILLDTKCVAKLNDDPAYVSDVDALEDWEDFESLISFAKDLHGEEGLCWVHPFGKELLKFKKEAMPQLKKHIPMYKNFSEYLGNIYRSLEMKYIPFNSKEQFDVPHKNQHSIEMAYQWYSDHTRNFMRKSA